MLKFQIGHGEVLRYINQPFAPDPGMTRFSIATVTCSSGILKVKWTVALADGISGTFGGIMNVLQRIDVTSVGLGPFLEQVELGIHVLKDALPQILYC